VTKDQCLLAVNTDVKYRTSTLSSPRGRATEYYAPYFPYTL